MINYYFLIGLVAIAASTATALPEDDGRIINGAAINIKQAPYMVRLLLGKGFCGGSLIHPKYVATAAHCVIGRNFKLFTVVANVTTTAQKGIRRKVIHSTIYPGYSKKTSHSDIAILELNQPIEGMKTLPLCSQPLKENDVIQLSGWGNINRKGTKAKTLQTAFEPVRSQMECDQRYGPSVQKNMFCAGGYDKVGFCFGDSGGPGVFNGELCGIVSFMTRCGEIGNFDAYTNVYDVRDFINDVMSAKK